MACKHLITVPLEVMEVGESIGPTHMTTQVCRFGLIPVNAQCGELPPEGPCWHAEFCHMTPEQWREWVRQHLK